MLSTVNDRSLSTNSYYTGGCAPALRLSASLPLGNHQRSTGTATGSREHGNASGRSQHVRPGRRHRRGADQAATASRRPSADSRIMVIMPTPSAAGRPAAATGSPGGGSRDSPETVAGRRRSGRRSPPFSGGERFSVRYRVLATLPPQSFISSSNTLTTLPQPTYPPNKKADQAHSTHLRFRYYVHRLLCSLTLRSYACRPNTVCKPRISPCFPF